MLTGQESHLLEDEIGFEPTELEQFISDALENARRYTDPAHELETMAKAAQGLLALWRRERADTAPCSCPPGESCDVCD